jgi:F0F1-type ATP synthase membrane subunit b/b'
MKLIFFSFFLNNEEAETFLEINSNFLETNIINILLLLGLLIYGYQTGVRGSLEARQKEIVETMENAQKDLSNTTKYYFQAENGFTQSLFWLSSWKTFYEKEKLEIVNSKYKQVKTGLQDTFLTIENLILNFEKKAFLSLQRYILLLTAAKILKKFLQLSESEQSKLI